MILVVFTAASTIYLPERELNFLLFEHYLQTLVGSISAIILFLIKDKLHSDGRKGLALTIRL